MTGQRALVIGASGGIGSALVAALAARGGMVAGLSRRDDGLDITDAASVEATLGALEPGFDMILVATGALHGAEQPPEKSLRHVTAAALADQYAINAIGPALILKHAPRLLRRDRRAVFAALSAKVGSIGDNHLGLGIAIARPRRRSIRSSIPARSNWRAVTARRSASRYTPAQWRHRLQMATRRIANIARRKAPKTCSRCSMV